MRRWSPRPLPPTTGHRKPSPPTRSGDGDRAATAGDGRREITAGSDPPGAGVGCTGGKQVESALVERREHPRPVDPLRHPCPSLGRRCRRRLPGGGVAHHPGDQLHHVKVTRSAPSTSAPMPWCTYGSWRSSTGIDSPGRPGRPAGTGCRRRGRARRAPPGPALPAALSRRDRPGGSSLRVGVEPGQNPVVAVEDGDDPTRAVAGLRCGRGRAGGLWSAGRDRRGRSPGGVGCGPGGGGPWGRASPSGRSGHRPRPARRREPGEKHQSHPGGAGARLDVVTLT